MYINHHPRTPRRQTALKTVYEAGVPVILEHIVYPFGGEKLLTDHTYCTFLNIQG
jgi:hypothetical protein